MRPGGERFLDALPTARTVLTRILWWDGNDWHIMHDAVGFHTDEELTPGSIMNALGKLLVLNQVADLKVFVGNQVVRRDKRVRRLTSEIFTLPLHFQRRFRQALSGLLAVLALLLFARYLPMETFEFRLSLAIMAWVRNLISVGVSVEDFQTHIDANHTTRLDMLTLAEGIYTELNRIPIGAMEDANPLDLLHGKGFDVLSGIADQAKSPNPARVSEDDVASIGFQLPSGGFVLHAPVIVLELGIPFLAGLVVAAILIEAGNGSPGTVGTGLTGLRIETVSKRVLFG
jgi:hypothetical protein